MSRRRLTYTQVQALQIRLDAADMAQTAEEEHAHLRGLIQIASSVLPAQAEADDTSWLGRLAERLGYRLELL